MFNAQVFRVKNLMALGKLLILLSGSVWADETVDPKFFEYKTTTIVGRATEMSFGWFKTLNDFEKDAYEQSIAHALLYTENGQKVRWVEGKASGETTVAMTWPVSDGYCRRLHIYANAYGVDKSMATTACFSDITSTWQWHPNK
jgi:surface antigen